MKNTTILALVAIILVSGGIFIFTGQSPAILSNNGPSSINVETQKVVIGQRGGNYYPGEIHVKAGVPVEISLDKSVQGCLRSFTVKDFGVSKYMPAPEDTLTFTPDKKGTFSFACSMGMAYGKLIVE